MGKINWHYLLHEKWCTGEIGEAPARYLCLVVAFVGPSALVMVDSHYAYPRKELGRAQGRTGSLNRAW